MNRRHVMSAIATAAALVVMAPFAWASVDQPATEEVPLEERCSFERVSVPSSVVDSQVVPLEGLGSTVSDATTGDLSIFGRLCVPKGRLPQTVILALHGITYDNSYWNVDYQPDTYNFARFMTDAGYAVFAIDRLGYGSSSRPPAQLVTLDAQAATAQEIVLALRDGRVGGTGFDRVALVGHSYGSATSWLTTSLHNEADVVVATGWANTIQTEPLARFFTGFYPSQLDPKFADANHPVGYVTPVPGSREQNFLYDLSNVDQEMLVYDHEVLRDTVTDGEAVTFYNRYGSVPLTYEPGTSDELTLPLSEHAKDIRRPTFLVNGSNELFFCGADTKHCNNSQELQRAEAPYFSEEACFRAAVTPNAGHDLNLQRNAPFTYETILTYLDQSLGADGRRYDDYVSSCAAYSGTNIPDGESSFGAFGGPDTGAGR